MLGGVRRGGIYEDGEIETTGDGGFDESAVNGFEIECVCGIHTAQNRYLCGLMQEVEWILFG